MKSVRRRTKNLQVQSIAKTETGSMTIKFDQPYAEVPTVILTPFWKGSGGPVGSVPTIDEITTGGCTITSGNFAGSNYFINVMAVESGASKIGGRLVQANSILKTGDVVELLYNPRFDTNDPVTLLSAYWKGQNAAVGKIDTLDDSSASEAKVVSGNKAANYFTNYVTMDAGIDFDDDSNIPIEANIVNKIGAGKMRVYFSTRFNNPPVVMLSPWWNDANAGVGSIETLTKVTTEYFEFVSANTAANYFVNWIAVGKG